jgi:hypothetical protein
MITKIEEDKIILQVENDAERDAILQLKDQNFFDTVYFLIVSNGDLIFTPMAPKRTDEPTKEVCVENVVKAESQI